jgi:HlyD family secretion protein
MKTLERPSSNGHAAHVETLTVGRKRPTRPWRAIIAVVVAVALIVTTVVLVRNHASANVSYVTTPVLRGDVVQTVTATGTVNPQNTIAVGTQVSGTISEIDADFNSHVTKGQILAKLDPTTLQAELSQSQASLAQSQAQARAAAANAQGAQTSVSVASDTARAAQASAQAAQQTAAMNQAAIATADANVTKAQSAATLANQTIARDKTLLAQGYIAQSQFDTDNSALVAAQTGVSSAQAAAQQARLQAAASASSAAASSAQSASQTAQTGAADSQAVGQAATAAASSAAIGIQAAQVQQAQLNLEHAVITSPVTGTVIARSVSVGQTVAASLQTPTLFTIAQDLSKMEVDLSVGEPDIGNMKAGDAVDFTVLAYPNRTFGGTVSQVRINPTTTNNVVTYTTVVLVSNTDGQLLPGMTANASIHIAKAANALTVPLSALAYNPPAGSASGARRGTRGTRGTRPAASGATPATTGAANGASANASPWGQTTGAAGAATTAGSTAHVYVQRNGAAVRVPVKIDLVNASSAAIEPLRGTLTTSDVVITGDSSTKVARTQNAASAGAIRNPLGGGAGGGGQRGGR